MRKLKNNSKIILCILTVCYICMIGIFGCGGDSTSEGITSKTKNNVENLSDKEYMIIEDYETQMDNEEAVFAGAYELYQTFEVELPDPVMLPTDNEVIWEGYTERELGLLESQEMPYCEVGINGCSFVWYDDIQYFNVNEINQQFGEGSPFSIYSNVWVTLEPENIQVLGGLEEYGRTGYLAGGKAE